ncbi:MAG: hypothetical protein ACOX2F_07920 [bacterium]
MKSLIFIVALLLVSCGDKGSVYDKYGDTGNSDTGNTDNIEGNGDTGNSGDTSGNDNTKDSEENDDPEGRPDAENGDDDNEEGGVDWTTCNGIILCTLDCLESDELCKSYCYNDGTNEEQGKYRRWKECFENSCFEEKTFECSVEKCTEESEACNISPEEMVAQPFPAPYGTATISANFKYIIYEGSPTSEHEFLDKPFITGKISKLNIAPSQAKIIASFVNYYRDGDVEMVEISQIPMLNETGRVLNPVVQMVMKLTDATKGKHSIGIDSEAEAKLMVMEIDEESEIRCHHAFAIGSFEIKEANIVTGSKGRLSISSSEIELFSPKNIPSHGGDIQDELEVTSCSLVK